MKENNHNSSRHWLRGIKDFFSQEPLWKIFSLIVAVLMWFIVMNTINPTEIKSFTAAVSIENMDALNEQGYVVSNLSDFENLTISLKIESTRPALDELSKTDNKNNIKAKIDLSKLEINSEDTFPKTYTMVIAPSLPSSSYVYNYKISSYYPTVAEVVIDKSDTKTVPVELKTYGSPLSGYVEDNVESSIKEVTVTGPKSQVSKVEKAVATIDITNEKGTVNKNCSMTVYDNTGTALKGFIISPDSIPITVDIKKSSTVNIDKPRTTGSLPDYLELSSIEWSPKSISVTSSSDNVPKSITLPPIDLTSIYNETTTTIDISDILDSFGLEAKETDKKVTVTIKVGVKEAEKYPIPTGIIKVTGLADNLNVSIPNNITVEIGGAENIDINTLSPTINLSGLGEGKHSVPLTLTLPPNATIKGEPTINIEITPKSTGVTENTTEAETTAATEITTSNDDNDTLHDTDNNQ